MKGGKGVVHEAMHRDDIGSIVLLWGKPGKPSNKYKRGYGLSHIIAKHGLEAVEPALEVVARADPVPKHLLGPKVVLEHGGHTVVVSRVPIGDVDVWLLTAFKIGRHNDIPTNLRMISGPFYFR